MSKEKNDSKGVTEVTKKSEKTEPIDNDNLDNTPPGSASIRERGVPNRAAIENRQGSGTTSKPPAMEGPSQPENVQVIQTMPYKATNPVKEARKKARATAKLVSVDKKRAAKKGGEAPAFSAKAIAAVIRTMDASDTNTANQLSEVLEMMEVDSETIQEIRQTLKTPELFSGDQKPANLQSLGLPPGAQKPPEFDVVPGTNTVPDARYYPTRFATMPDEEDYAEGDLVFNVHEDGSFTVLSVAQQTPEWQASHHTPQWNLITRFGGDVVDTPNEVRREGLNDEKKVEKTSKK